MSAWPTSLTRHARIPSARVIVSVRPKRGNESVRRLVRSARGARANQRNGLSTFRVRVHMPPTSGGSAVNPVEVDGTTFDLIERFGGAQGQQDPHIEIAEPSRTSHPRAWRITQAPASRLASLQFNFGGSSSSLRSVRNGASMRDCAGARSLHRSVLEDPQTSGGG